MRILEYCRDNWRRQNGWLLPLEILLGVVLLGALASDGFLAWHIARRPLPVTVTLGFPRTEVEKLLLPGVHIPGTRDASAWGDIQVVLDQPTREQLVWIVQGNAPRQFLFTAVLVVLLHIVHTARRNPFSAANVLKLRILAVFLFLGGYVCVTLEKYSGIYLSGSVTNGEWGGYYDRFGLVYYLLVALVLFGVSQVIKRGCDIRAELDEVI
jgi:hypothetical protein